MEIQPLTYQPPPHKPERFDEGLCLIAGVNPFGENKLRVVWGMDARCFRSGKPDAVKYPSLGKELGAPFWFIEEWWSPERLGTREEWQTHRYFDGVDLLGEYPGRGLYFLFGGSPLVESDGSNMELNERALTIIFQLWNDRLQPNGGNAENARRYAEIQRRADAMEEEQKRRASAEMDVEWDGVKTNWEANEARKTKQYSFPNETRTPSGLIIPKSALN